MEVVRLALHAAFQHSWKPEYKVATKPFPRFQVSGADIQEFSLVLLFGNKDGSPEELAKSCA